MSGVPLTIANEPRTGAGTCGEVCEGICVDGCAHRGADVSPETSGAAFDLARHRRIHIRVRGVVQGVGFRPFVHRHAARLGLSGFVLNTSGGVEIEVEGAPSSCDALVGALRNEPPPLARITSMAVREVDARGDAGFRILESERTVEAAALLPPDTATCEACLAEMRDPANRRFEYPFTNCTECGPRFTIVESVPYDRKQTTMRDFRLCEACEREYNDPLDRRYHAEPNACPVCGPSVTLLGPAGELICGGASAIRGARAMLRLGAVVAVKGLGGFHLACDAANERAVVRLRRRKGRPHKPLAVMCRDRVIASAHSPIRPAEAEALARPERPILLVRKRGFAPSVAPGQRDVGVMLPYTPIHHLLLTPPGPDSLVMTSGNRSEEPIATSNEEALEVLDGIADAFLAHDRPIWNRCDDSVGFVRNRNLVLIRRSRGYAPLPVDLGVDVRPTLAVGAMFSNAFALASERRAFLSQHIGDVDNEATLAFLRESIGKLTRWLGITPEIVARDMHPDLLTTHLARELSRDGMEVPVQHHHAHLASALAASGFAGEAQGLVLDGTGWGPDGTIWGGELLVGSAASVRRAGHLRPLPLPGGEAAIRRPVRAAIAYLHVMAPFAFDLDLDLFQRARPEEIGFVRRMVDRGFNTPLTSSAGRLFDAAAALLGVRDEVTYEGQAAIELEHAASSWAVTQFPSSAAPARSLRLRMDVAEDRGPLVIDPAPAMGEMARALSEGESSAALAYAFHDALSRALVSACVRVHELGGPRVVALCGGVFQNRLLTRLVSDGLFSCGLDAILPGAVPVNDGGLALGQILVANAASGAGGNGMATEAQRRRG